MKYFNRYDMKYFPLSERHNKVRIENSCVYPEDNPGKLDSKVKIRIEKIAEEIKKTRSAEKPVMLVFGAHTIKNGLGLLISILAEQGWITHLATNGAGVIHDWEFSFQGKTSEDVRANVQEGKFGTWEETGLYINLSIIDGAYRGLGYGESVGSLILNDGILIPEISELENVIRSDIKKNELWKVSAAADYLELINSENLKSGWLKINHPYKKFSIQQRALASGIPFTSHPMFGHDIIYTHRASRGAAIGRCAERDFLSYVKSVENLEGGVYLSIGSAVMSPMIFEKSLSMARNAGNVIKNCGIHVVDLQKETWDWSKGEPPADNPAYYLRFMKTFSRMGCNADYTSADNRDFLLYLSKLLLN